MSNEPSSNPLQLVERIRHAAAYPHAEGVLNMARFLCRAADRIERLQSERKELAFEAFNAGRQRGTCEVVCKNWTYDVQEDEPDFEKWWEKKNEKAESKS